MDHARRQRTRRRHHGGEDVPQPAEAPQLAEPAQAPGVDADVGRLEHLEVAGAVAIGPQIGPSAVVVSCDSGVATLTVVAPVRARSPSTARRASFCGPRQLPPSKRPVSFPSRSTSKRVATTPSTPSSSPTASHVVLGRGRHQDDAMALASVPVEPGADLGAAAVAVVGDPEGRGAGGPRRRRDGPPACARTAPLWPRRPPRPRRARPAPAWAAAPSRHRDHGVAPAQRRQELPHAPAAGERPVEVEGGHHVVAGHPFASGAYRHRSGLGGRRGHRARPLGGPAAASSTGAPWRPAPEAKRAAPCWVSPLAMVWRPNRASSAEARRARAAPTATGPNGGRCACTSGGTRPARRRARRPRRGRGPAGRGGSRAPCPAPRAHPRPVR